MTRVGDGGGHHPREGRPPKVIIHVKNIGEQRLRGGLLDVQLLHLLGHHDCLSRNFLSRSGHFKQPGEPLEEDNSNLYRYVSVKNLLISRGHLKY